MRRLTLVEHFWKGKQRGELKMMMLNIRPNFFFAHRLFGCITQSRDNRWEEVPGEQIYVSSAKMWRKSQSNGGHTHRWSAGGAQVPQLSPPHCSPRSILHFHPFITIICLFISLCLLKAQSCFSPALPSCRHLPVIFSLTCHHHQTLSNLLSLPFCLIFSVSASMPGHVPSKQCLSLVPVCMLPCRRCHFLALYPCERKRGGGTVRERKARGKEERQGKQGNACRCRAHLVYKYANAVAFVICKWEITER